MTETLFQRLEAKMKKNYKARARCSNCGVLNEIEVPKGITISEFFEGKQGLCKTCGCATLTELKGKALTEQEKKEKKEQEERETLKKKEEAKRRISIKQENNLWGPTPILK